MSQLATPVIFGVQHMDGLPVTPGYAVSAGETLAIYATGLGEVNVNLNCGAGGPKEPLANTLLTPALTLAGIPMTVLFSGLAPGFAGLYQVNATAPDSMTGGRDAALTLTAAGISASMTLAVR